MIPADAVDAAYVDGRSPEFPVTCKQCWALVDYANRQKHLLWHEAPDAV